MTVLARSAALAAAAALQTGPVITAPTPAGAATSAPVVTAPSSRPTAAPPGYADPPVEPQTRAPPSALDGASPAQVKARLGQPAVEHAEGAGAIWTYRLTRCALFVYFSDAGRGLRVSGTDAGPRRHGEDPPDAATCLAAAPAPSATLPPTSPAAAPPTVAQSGGSPG